MIISTQRRLTIRSTETRLTAAVLPRVGVMIQVIGDTAHLADEEVRALAAWLAAVTE